MSEVTPGTAYLLAHSDEAYFGAIRSSQTYLSKLYRLKEYLPEAGTIVSLGMAGGGDLCTLDGMYGEETRLIGIDISPVALELARRATSAAGVKADFIERNATRLDIPNGSVDGFILFAILHEVYSYAEDGKSAFVKAIEESFRKTSRNGCIFISDFAGPKIKGQASLKPRSDEATQFIDYFLHNFRKFNDTEQPLANNDRHRMNSSTWEGDVLHSDTALVSEVLWHFKHFRKNVGNFTFDKEPQGWKEINEVYLPPNPFDSEDRSMSIDDYAAAVLRICHNAEISGEVPLRCVSAALTPQRQDTIDMLDEHFSVTLDDETTSRALIAECTNWMDLIFKKEEIV
jgi:ubiquinone/menaquinone biosynthesis C-methylase UbiE